MDGAGVTVSRPVTYDKRIPVALTAEQVAALDVAAKAAGLTRSAWIRTTLLKAAALAAVLCLAVACGDYVVEEPAPVPRDVRLDTATPVERPWPTASQAVTAECSGLCRWEVRCLPDVELSSCEATCHAQLCAGVDCDAPPSGTDAQLELCIHTLLVESAAPYACAAGETPYAYTEPCEKLVKPTTVSEESAR